MVARVKRGQRVLLLGAKAQYLVPAIGKFSSKYGCADFSKIIGKPFGKELKVGKERFIVVEPNIIDFLFRSARGGGPQVTLPKDAAAVLAITGCNKNSKVVEAGTGSAWLAVFLANHVDKVYTYERRKESIKIAKKNIINSGLKNIILKQRDISNGIAEKNVDLVVLDMEEPEKVVKKTVHALKPGGWLVVLSVHPEQAALAAEASRKAGFGYVRTTENLQRDWSSYIKGRMSRSRPRTDFVHSCFLTVARKI
jgi:tRNA (adenine57-N1/adenine58-N1)-methyltransferase